MKSVLHLRRVSKLHPARGQRDIQSAQCDRSYSTLPHYPNTWPKGIRKETLCAGDLNGGRDACQGDSGSTWTVRVGRYRIAGILPTLDCTSTCATRPTSPGSRRLRSLHFEMTFKMRSNWQRTTTMEKKAHWVASSLKGQK
ncbi:Serine protease Hayan [Portunus trituberculatus]|uniref:Serine protease Hayan n=1 Tax=Portunus trituberculatus TaxID=210409 RepID=A0A5B7IKW1_PORTR|nr:Serine protease Hayan [Portunus trituberculatus]